MLQQYEEEPSCSTKMIHATISFPQELQQSQHPPRAARRIQMMRTQETHSIPTSARNHDLLHDPGRSSFDVVSRNYINRSPVLHLGQQERERPEVGLYFEHDPAPGILNRDHRHVVVFRGRQENLPTEINQQNHENRPSDFHITIVMTRAFVRPEDHVAYNMRNDSHSSANVDVDYDNIHLSEDDVDVEASFSSTNDSTSPAVLNESTSPSAASTSSNYNYAFYDEQERFSPPHDPVLPAQPQASSSVQQELRIFCEDRESERQQMRQLLFSEFEYRHCHAEWRTWTSEEEREPGLNRVLDGMAALLRNPTRAAYDQLQRWFEEETTNCYGCCCGAASTSTNQASILSDALCKWATAECDHFCASNVDQAFLLHSTAT
ncbi:unnamed protein product [Amoebophrya sp. A120]|nr:unnamed protein product [Amoebophrya sp. A120]|eukprot:GSA120T00000911001.1